MAYPYLDPRILRSVGLIPPDTETEDERTNPYRDLNTPASAPVQAPDEQAPVEQPNPYRQIGQIPWVTEQPSTAKPDEMIRRDIQVPITEGPSGERSLRAPEGTATWTPEQPGQPVSALARRMGAGQGPGTYNTGTGTFTPRAEEERIGTLMAEAGARKETEKQNLIANILSTVRSYWGAPTAGAKGAPATGGEVDRVGRVGELLTVFKQLYPSSPLPGLLTGETGTTAGQAPGGYETSYTVGPDGKVTTRLTPKGTRTAIGVGARSYDDYVREAESKGLKGADRTRYAEEQMRKAAVERVGAESVVRRGPQIPLTPAEATQAGVPMGTTRGDMTGQIPTTPKTRQSITELDVSENMLDFLGGLADQLITTENWVEAAAQGVRLTAAAATRSNRQAAVFSDQRKALLGIFSRQIGAERGVLTDRDIERIDDALPKFRDTKSIKDDKLAFLRSMITVNREARTRAIDSLLSGRALSGQRGAASSPGGAGGGPSGPAAPQTKTIGGKTYEKRDGKWYEQ